MKTTINNIFFPTDFSECALNAFRYAIWLADHYNATIDVWHYVPVETTLADIPVISAEMTKKHVDAGKEVMESFKNAGIANAVEKHELTHSPLIESHVVVGAPTRLIAKNAEENNHDLIVMGTQGEHDTIEKILGSVTTSAINKASCHVMAIPSTFQQDRITSIAFATDLLDSDPIQIWETTRLFEPFPSSFKAVHAEEKGTGVNSIELDITKAYFKDKDPNLDISFHTVFGDKITALLDKFISDNNIDLMVMYRPKHSLFERLFHRSVTRQLALHTKIPLFVLK